MGLHVTHAMGNVTELDRADSRIGFVMGMETTLGEHLDLQLNRVAKHNGLGDAWRNVGPPLVVHAFAMQCCCKLAEVTVRRNLERDPVKMGGGAALKSDCLQPKFGGENNLIGATVDDLQPNHTRLVIDLPFDVRRDQTGVAEPMHFHHHTFP